MKNNRDINRRDFLRTTTGLSLIAYLPKPLHGGTGTLQEKRARPLANAMAVWHMDKRSEHELGPEGIKICGDVALGVALKGNELAASLARGGDGKIAEFRGGYLLAGSPNLDLRGKKHMTLCMRIRGLGEMNTVFISVASPEDPYSGVLYIGSVNRSYLDYQTSKQIKQDTAVEYQWKTTPAKDRVKPEFFDYEWAKILSGHEGFTDGVLHVQAPTGLMDPEAWHDVIIRFNSATLELFVDGVLMDEEWPNGSLQNFRGPLLIGAGYQDGTLKSGFHGHIDHIAIWDRPLRDEEILELSGGRAEVAARVHEMLGNQQKSLQYWHPHGINTSVGDCMPLYIDGKFHLFYLLDRHHHHSKWGMGAHQFAHASSTDLVHWEHHPMAIALTRQWECSIGTGSIVLFRDEYHAFYIQHGRRCWFKDAPYAGGTVQTALSPDSMYFHKILRPVVPWVYLRRKDGSPGDINPDIFPDVQDSDFYLSLSGEKIWASSDLETWKEQRIFNAYRDIGTGICSSQVEWNGWHYIVSSAGYRMSREPLHPGWSFTAPANPATQEGLGVPQIARFHGDRCLMVGFLAAGDYAGDAVFRELLQHKDGVLGTKWPAEMIPQSGPPLDAAFKSIKGISRRDGRTIHVGTKNEFSVCALDGLPQDVRIRAQIKATPDTRAFGLCVRGSGAYENGCEVRFEPAKRTVQFGSPAHGKMAPTSEMVVDRSDFSIGSVDLPPDGFEVDLIVRNDFVDVCIRQERTMIIRRADRPQGDLLFFFSEMGEVSFINVSVCPLIEDSDENPSV